MTRLPRWILPLAVLFASAAHAEPLAPAFQLGVRPTGYQLALSQDSASGNAFAVDLLYRVSDPAASHEWLLGAELDLVRSLTCPGGNGGYCGTEGQLWLTAQHAFHRQGHWSAYSTIQLGGGGLWPQGGSLGMVGGRVGVGGDYWINPQVALELLPSYTVGVTLGSSSGQLYENLGLQFGVRVGW